MKKTPYTQIKQELAELVAKPLVELLPKKWEKIGDILILVIPDQLQGYEYNIAKTYAKQLQCRCVLADEQSIQGVHRIPHMRLLYGPTQTITVHKENNILYTLDPQQIMFSSGNMDERLRMAHIQCTDETIIDLFTGIGYFTLPLAVYAHPKKIIACEINPVSYGFLQQNIYQNNVVDKVEPLLGDNRITAPKHQADRILMGYLHETHTFLPTAFNCLKPSGGIIHYHTTVSKKHVSILPTTVIEPLANKYDLTIQVHHIQQVKSYAPGILHVVYDLEVRPQ